MRRPYKAPRKNAQRLVKRQLAKRLGVTRTTLDTYLAMDGAPKEETDRHEYRVKAVEMFIAEHASMSVGNERRTLNSIKARKLESDAQMAEMDLAIKRRDYIPVKEIEPAVAQFNAQLLADLETKFVHELPAKYKRMTELEAQEANKEGIVWVLTRLKTGQGEILPAKSGEKPAQ